MVMTETAIEAGAAAQLLSQVLPSEWCLLIKETSVGCPLHARHCRGEDRHSPVPDKLIV